MYYIYYRLIISGLPQFQFKYYMHINALEIIINNNMYVYYRLIYKCCYYYL